MRKPFILRVESDDTVVAECIARALEPALAARGTRAHLVTRQRALKGVAVTIAVWDEALGARWLAPIEVPLEPLAAADHVTRFLEEWGFIHASTRAPSKPRVSET